MHEQRTEPPLSSEGRITRRLYNETAGGTRPPQVPPRTDHRRALGFVLVGLGLAMLFSNIAKLPFAQGRQQTIPVATALDGATAAHVRFDWGNGSLRLDSGEGSELVSGYVSASKPLVFDVGSYDDSEERTADVSIRPPSTGWLFGGFSSASGNLTLNQQPRYELLEFDLESGSANLDLSRLDVSELNLDGGSGSIVLQLPSQGAIEGAFDLGSGSLNMTLPPDMEARIVLDRGSGSFSADERLRLVDGDDDEGGVYETPGYDDEAAQRIELDVDSGSGSIVIN